MADHIITNTSSRWSDLFMCTTSSIIMTAPATPPSPLPSPPSPPASQSFPLSLLHNSRQIHFKPLNTLIGMNYTVTPNPQPIAEYKPIKHLKEFLFTICNNKPPFHISDWWLRNRYLLKHRRSDFNRNELHNHNPAQHYCWIQAHKTSREIQIHHLQQQATFSH